MTIVLSYTCIIYYNNELKHSVTVTCAMNKNKMGLSQKRDEHISYKGQPPPETALARALAAMYGAPRGGRGAAARGARHRARWGWCAGGTTPKI